MISMNIPAKAFGKKSVEENTVGSGNGEVVQRIAKFEYTPYDPSREGSISGPGARK